MNKPISELFIDGGDPEETRKANVLLRSKKPEWGIGIQGQTTNPTLVAKNPDVQKYLAQGKKLTPKETLTEYKKIVTAVAEVTKGPISIQVIGDQTTKKDDMLAQARVYKNWIPNGVVKFPCTYEGLAAAEVFCQEFPVNITLNFSLSQAAAVYESTRNARYRVFVSPFVGRLDDRGENGMQLIEDEMKLLARGQNLFDPQLDRDSAQDNHKGIVPPRVRSAQISPTSLSNSSPVEVLTASVRTLDHLLYALKLNSHAITIPFKVFALWADKNFPLPDDHYTYPVGQLKPLPVVKVELGQPWTSYDLKHDLTDKGLEKFMSDWQSLLK